MRKFALYLLLFVALPSGIIGYRLGTLRVKPQSAGGELEFSSDIPEEAKYDGVDISPRRKSRRVCLALQAETERMIR